MKNSDAESKLSVYWDQIYIKARPGFPLFKNGMKILKDIIVILKFCSNSVFLNEDMMVFLEFCLNSLFLNKDIIVNRFGPWITALNRSSLYF